MAENKQIIRLCDGKYTYVITGSERFALRYNEPWRDLTGDNLVAAMADRILDLEARLEKVITVCNLNEFLIETSTTEEDHKRAYLTGRVAEMTARQVGEQQKTFDDYHGDTSTVITDPVKS